MGRNPGCVFGALVTLVVLGACQTFQTPQLSGQRIQGALTVLESPRSNPRERARAKADYRRALANVLPGLRKDLRDPPFEFRAKRASGDFRPGAFADIVPVRRSREITPGLHRSGLGLPAVGKISPGGANAPRAGYCVPLTVLALPMTAEPEVFGVRLADPERVESVRVGRRNLPVAMDLEAALDATRATGPRLLDGLGYLLRSDRKKSRLIFLQPYDPEKIPVVLVHGLISTPRMWAPVVKGLLSDPEIRRRYQLWFFYYPSGQPVPLSALQLREALDEAVRQHQVRRPLVLVGHSMGGILARAQVSRLTAEEAETILPNVSSLPPSSRVRRCLIFEPREDVSRVVFICTPHRGSRLALSSLGGLAVWLIRLPAWITEELGDIYRPILTGGRGRLPTSIHGLSPYSSFLKVLNRAALWAPTHSIIGARDGVVPFASAHLDSAASEILVPTGHGGFAHPSTIDEIKRILKSATDNGDAP